MLVYHDNPVPESRLVWFDRTGRLVDPVVPTAHYGDPSISPDSRSAAFLKYDIDTRVSDIWRVDLGHGGMSRVTNSNAFAVRPVWSPRADEMLYSMKRNLAAEMYRITPGGGPERLVQPSATNQTATDWRMDGRFILYENFDPKTKSDLWLLPQQGDQTPIPYLRTPFNETRGKFSPDGRWVAYTSDESGTSDVYIQSLPTSARKWLVSARGGSQCIWRRDGKELFYVASDRWMMAVPVRAAGSTLELGTATRIFELPDGATMGRLNYDVSADGQRFLVNVAVKEGPFQPLAATVVVNWVASVQRSR